MEAMKSKGWAAIATPSETQLITGTNRNATAPITLVMYWDSREEALELIRLLKECP